jgi:hypothetical protein
MPESAPTTWLTRLAGTGLKLTWSSTTARETILADTQLIAAAPDMLKALIFVQHQLGIQEFFHPIGIPLLFIADPPATEIGITLREAIRKATGESWVEPDD